MSTPCGISQHERLKTAANIVWGGALSQAEKLCRIYFEIAAETIGEDAVRRKRDQRIATMTPNDKDQARLA